jgi:hypothetical protein
MRSAIAAVTALLLIAAGPALAQEQSGFKTPEAAASVDSKPNPGYRNIGEFHSAAELDSVRKSLADGALVTLPTWTEEFSIKNQQFSYTFVGSHPSSRKQTVVLTVIVPVRLTVPDYLVNGKPLVLDASKATASVEGSPIFYPSFYDSGVRQFGDAMLHTEFPEAAHSWGTVLSPSVAQTLDITAPKGSVQVVQAKSGKLLAIIKDDSVIDKPLAQWTRDFSSPSVLVIFNTYNALEHDAFGYHSFLYANQKSQALVYIYNSWLEGAGDALGIPSPNAATLSHEVAEVIHDPLGTSLTQQWGDAFDRNRCFQRFIEVGDAIEDAPADLQFYDQWGSLNGLPKLYTLQNEALLPWFERQSPSKALGHAFSFPGDRALTSGAPMDCKK